MATTGEPLLDPAAGQQPLGEGDAAQHQGEAPKKKRRRKAVADINVALYIKQQQTRGPTRKWRQQWVNVRTIVGGGEVKMLKWVSDTPPAGPTAAIPGFANFQSIQASRKRERQLQQQQDPLSKAAAAAAAAASAAERQWRGGSLSRLNSTSSLDPAAAAAAGGDFQQAAGFGATPQAPGSAAGDDGQTPDPAAAAGAGDIRSMAASIAAAVAAEAQGGDGEAAAAGDGSAGPKKKRKLSAGAAGEAAAVGEAGGSGGSQFACPTCGRQFAAMGSLRKHMHVHQTKSFVCTHPGCNKSFADAAKLERHAEKHSASKDIRCPACDKCFFTVFNLRTHWKQLHKEIPPPPSLFAAAKPAAGDDG